MNCPNCNEPMSEGALYCEKCGHEIHIVPDFDPEVENNIEQSLSKITLDLKRDRKKREKTEADTQDKGVPAWMFTLFNLFLAVVLIAVVIGGFWIYRYNNIDHQIRLAKQYYRTEQYGKSLKHYKRALALDEQNISLKFAIADIYNRQEIPLKYEDQLLEIAADENATIEQLESAYNKLIALYKEKDDLERIRELILASDNQTIIAAYQDYIAREPEFSVMGGYYDEPMAVKISAYGTGTIYYTMDGTEPTADSEIYMAPIVLESGDYVVKAFFVKDSGASSKVVTAEYHIEIEELEAPKIDLVSGSYTRPAYIKVINEDDEDIYYTLDGTDPTVLSYPYTGPILLALGRSDYKFAKIVSGRTSDITMRRYALQLSTDFTPGQAETAIMEYFYRNGRLIDENGHFDSTGARYQYTYTYVVTIDGDDYYIISEILQDTEGILTGTGNYYAVNAYTGKYFTLQDDGNNNYTLVDNLQEMNQEESQ